MPFALANFSAEAFSLWMIFVIFYSLIVVFDFGLTTTIARQFNYILAGADTITKSGLSSTSNNKVNETLFTQLYLSSRKIFTSIAFGVSVLLLLAYFFYFKPITVNYPNSIFLEWSLYSLAIVISLFSLTYNAIFFGTHNVTSIYRVCSVSNLAFFAVAIILILLDYGLLAIAIARLISALIYLVHAKYEIKAFDMLAHYKQHSKGVDSNVLKAVLPNAAKFGGVTLGNFLVSKASVLIVAAYLPLAQSGSYALALNIVSVIMSVSLLFMTIKTPQLNALRQEKNYYQLDKLQAKIRLLCMPTALFALGGFVLLGNHLLAIIGANTELPSTSTLLVFVLLCLLEVNRSISMNFIMTANQVPFFKTVMITAVSCVILIIFMLEMGATLIIVPILVQLFAQSVFNNWYWTLQEFRDRSRMLLSI
jgi:O-antigen/teichoic acid export membrane protein